MNETIKSVTHCPTCGSEVTVGGKPGEGSTHYYVPKEPEYTRDDVINFGARITGWDKRAVEDILGTYTKLVEIEKRRT